MTTFIDRASSFGVDGMLPSPLLFAGKDSIPLAYPYQPKSLRGRQPNPRKKLLYAPPLFRAILLTARTVPVTEGRMEARIGSVIGHLRRTALRHDRNHFTDGQLLDRFLARREEAAFEALVQRHGPMVLGVCQRVLHNAHDAE